MSADIAEEYAQIPRKFGDYQIDWLCAGDVGQIVELEQEWFPEPLAVSELTRLIQEANTCYIVARHGKQVIGYIGFQFFLAAAHTISMGVDATYRRQNLATVLQKTADAVARNRGARWFTGEVRASNKRQLRFLRGLGWLEVGRCKDFFGNGEDAVVVWNWL